MISKTEMRFKLDHVIAFIESTDQEWHSITKSFSELLDMKSGDMAIGFNKRKVIIDQARKNHARFIASIILTILLQKEPGFISSDKIMISWTEQKNNKLWKKFGVYCGKTKIERLDWFIHNMMVLEKYKIKDWLYSSEKWELFQTEDDQISSDVEYDEKQRIIAETIEIKPDDIQKQNGKQSTRCTDSWLMSLFLCK